MRCIEQFLVVAVMVLISALGVDRAPADTIRLSSLDVSYTRQGWGQPHRDRTVVGDTLRLAGKAYEYGLGTHSDSILWVDLAGDATRLKATVGLDDDSSGTVGSVRFFVYGDDKRLYDSGVIKAGQEPVPVDVNVSGVRRLALIVDDAGDGGISDHADWAEARLEYSGTMPTHEGCLGWRRAGRDPESLPVRTRSRLGVGQDGGRQLLAYHR